MELEFGKKKNLGPETLIFETRMFRKKKRQQGFLVLSPFFIRWWAVDSYCVKDNMQRGRVLLMLVALTLMTVVLQHTDACSCMPAHPQQQYCSADFVILARIKREKQLNDTLIYKVRVRKQYKLSEKAAVALKSGRLLTSVHDNLCGIRLEVGKIYAVSGRVHSLKAYINMCGLSERWENLSRRQRKGLKVLYRHGCTCDIKTCLYTGGRCGRTRDACNWTHETCQATEGICLRGASQTCSWSRNTALTKCLKKNSTENNDNPLTISRWSG